jgi:hypothetical protein
VREENYLERKQRFYYELLTGLVLCDNYVFIAIFLVFLVGIKIIKLKFFTSAVDFDSRGSGNFGPIENYCSDPVRSNAKNCFASEKLFNQSPTIS